MTTLFDSPAKFSASPHALNAIRHADCNLAVWERPANAAFGALLDASPHDVRFAAPLDEIETRLTAALVEAGYADSDERAALIADIAGLARRYAAIMELDAISVRLAIVTTDSCRKFHADYVTARLITTYLGTGTQWIDAEDAVRVARDQAPLRIHTFGTGDVGLFKGKIWTQNPAIHRSPPIEQAGESRLMLVLDPPREAAAR